MGVLFIVGDTLYLSLVSNRPKSRLLRIATAAIVLMALAFAAWQRWSVPDWDFPVDRISWLNGAPVFGDGGLIPEERVSVANEVRQRTWRPVVRAIVADHAQGGVRAYAFTGNTRGVVYTLRSAGLDGWEIIREDKWAGDPQALVVRRSGGD